MNKIDRRTAVTVALASGMTMASVNSSPSTPHPEQQEDELGKPTKDQGYVMEAGMTHEEAECWSKVADAAAAFFALPEEHPLDKAEVVTAIHVIQNKLLSRPTYRKYIKLAKAGYEAEQAKDKEKKEGNQ